MTIGGALASLSVWGPASACAQEPESSRGLFEPPKGPQPAGGLYPAARTEKYELARPLTSEEIAGTHNNFYEFANGQSHGQAFQKAVAEAARDYEFRPWEVEIGGLCESPRTMSIDDIEKLAPLEERLYRFRCVETWAMAVPWTGYSLSKLIEAEDILEEGAHAVLETR